MDKRGYTLLELLVVLIIISLVSAFVVPNLGSSLGNLSLKTAAKKLSAALRYARNSAVSEKVTYVTLCNIDDNQIIVVPEKDKVDESLQNALNGEKRQAKESLTYALPSDIKIEEAMTLLGEVAADTFSIFFFPNGSSTGGKITLINEKDRHSRVLVDMVTGSVKISGDL